MCHLPSESLDRHQKAHTAAAVVAMAIEPVEAEHSEFGEPAEVAGPVEVAEPAELGDRFEHAGCAELLDQTESAGHAVGLVDGALGVSHLEYLQGRLAGLSLLDSM